MITFIKKSTIFVFILSLILGYANSEYKDTNVYKRMNSTDKFFNIPEQIEIANLGTSHAQYAFVYEELDAVGFNFALPAQRLYYDKKIFEKYANKFKKDSTLILPISYISLYLGYDNENFEEFNKMYYQFLGIRDIKNPNLEDYIKYKALPILTAESNIKYIFIEEEPYEPKPIYKNHTISLEEMKENGLETATRHIDFINEGKGNKEEFMDIIDNIIQIAINKDINPVIVTTPFTRYYNDHFPQEFYDEFQDAINKLLEKYPDIKYLDYSHDPRFENSPEYFFDSSHLNLKGGKLFTKIIMDKLKLQ